MATTITEQANTAVMTEAEKKRLEALRLAQQGLVTNATTDPTKMTQTAEVSQVQTNQNQFVNTNAGQAPAATGYTANTVGQTATATAPQGQGAATFESVKVTPQVEQHLEGVEAAQGTVSKDATVQGQYEKLMEQFKDGEVPPWAAGAIRNANATMQARGLGASSMAGAAVTQAAMESALPIASQDANIYAQMDLQNLSNRQQTTLYKSQQMIAGMFNDQAAENVERQINAASKNQVTQFYASLHAQVEQFNKAQINAMNQFNAGEKNTASRFTAELKSAREMFNAQNSLIVAQANAKWRQDIATMDTAAQNAANMEAAKAANGFTDSALDAIWQRERDIIAFAFQSAENEAQRNLEIFLADKEIKFAKSQAKADRDAQNKRGLGQIVGTIVGGLFG